MSPVPVRQTHNTSIPASPRRPAGADRAHDPGESAADESAAAADLLFKILGDRPIAADEECQDRPVDHGDTEPPPDPPGPLPAEPRPAAVTRPRAGRRPPAAASALALEPDLVAAIRRDLEAVGLVGESDEGLLAYLAYSSRKLKKPLSLIVKGPSGSGKDEVQRRPAELIPPEDVVTAMSLTPQALYYGEPGWLSHKVLLGGERSHQDDAPQRDRTAAVRQMLSHGFITKMTVVDGETVSLRQDGPVSYSETTTKDSVFGEDANRCLQVTTDPSPDQTRRILAAMGRRYDPAGSGEAGREAVLARHHEFQRALAGCDVRIPFHRALADAVPAGKVAVRRAFGHLLSLIEVVAFVHQFHRTRDTQGRLLATVEDYALARRLILGPLHALIGLGADHVKLEAFARKLPAGEFDTPRAATALDASSRKVAHTWLGKLAEAGVVVCVVAGVGNRPARWRRTGKAVDEVLLPSVEAVRRACVTA